MQCFLQTTGFQKEVGHRPQCDMPTLGVSHRFLYNRGHHIPLHLTNDSGLISNVHKIPTVHTHPKEESLDSLVNTNIVSSPYLFSCIFVIGIFFALIWTGIISNGAMIR